MKAFAERSFTARAAALAALAVFGTVAALVVTEGALRLAKGPPAVEAVDEDFVWRYFDIHRPFFRLKGGVYVNARPRSNRLRMGAEKAPGERRVFIIGESFAAQFPAEYLSERMERVLPGYDWQVVNAGMCGYDSYRVRLVAEELPRYSPDLVVLMMLHNEGLHDPVKIDRWPYRSSLVARSHVLRLFTGLLDPPVVTRDSAAVNRLFEKNLERISAVLRDRGIPLVVVVLPRNWYTPGPGMYWVSDGPEWPVPRADAGPGERLFVPPKRPALPEQPDKAERRAMLRRLAGRRDGVLLVDFDRRLAAASADGPGCDWFSDGCHVWRPVYGLLADDIVEALYRYDRALPAGAPGKLSGWRYAEFRPTAPSEALRASGPYARRVFLRDEAAEPQRLPYIVPFRPGWHNSNLAIVDRCWTADPDTVRSLRTRLQFSPNPPPESLLATFSRYLAAGDYLRLRGEYEAALAHLDDAVRAEPGRYEGYLLRGACLLAAGRRDEAEKDFAAARRLEPSCSAYIEEKMLEKN